MARTLGTVTRQFVRFHATQCMTGHVKFQDGITSVKSDVLNGWLLMGSDTELLLLVHEIRLSPFSP